LQEFLHSGGEDLSELDQRLQQSLAEEQQFWHEGLARGDFEPLVAGIRNEVQLLQEQLQHLGSPDEPVVGMAFKVLYELAGPHQASGGREQEQDELFVMNDEPAAGPNQAGMDFDAGGWDETALANLDHEPR
jgi:hypothetical protein